MYVIFVRLKICKIKFYEVMIFVILIIKLLTF